ncbi:uncharacterized protein [Epargyreus clarus]|uniref:uncharacterized protein n=1 Tax=Epargyreus clarus TaxID=520877 RepID=UPI003C2CCADC
MVSKILCFAVIVGLASGATWQGYQPAKPKEFAHKEGCYIEEINDVIKYGEEIAPIGICYRIECSKYMVYYASCGVVGTSDPKCYVTDTDPSKPYPQCCPNIKCEVDNNIA